MNVYGGAIVGLKESYAQYSFDFYPLLIRAKTKEEARKIAEEICEQQFPEKDGYSLRKVSVTNAITEVKT